MQMTLLGKTTGYAVERFVEEAPALEIDLDVVSLTGAIVDVADNAFTLFDPDGNDITERDCYLFRGIGDADQEVMVIAKYLLERGATVIEEKAASGALFMDKLFFASDTIVDPNSRLPDGAK